jgi:NTP pyrophosphatase (non-canonical NTP hydrolase)
MTARFDYADLQTLMARLRDPVDGCPWDIKQTYASIVPHTLEEVYEVIDTIERNDLPHLAEELGDLLFQVVFYAQIAADMASDGGRWLRRRGEGGEEVVVMVQGVALWAERTRIGRRSSRQLTRGRWPA